MIIDDLSAHGRYKGVHPLLPSAFSWLAGLSLDSLPEAKLALQGTALFALPFRSEGKSRDMAKLEDHRRYIDIHYLLEGREEIGLRAQADCRRPQAAFDEENDYVLFDDAIENWSVLLPGQFLLVWPGEAHAPGVGSGRITKVVVKLLV